MRSKTIEKRVAKDDRLESYETDEDFGVTKHWVHLADGYVNTESGCHSIAETTVKAVLQCLTFVERCDCESCTN